MHKTAPTGHRRLVSLDEAAEFLNCNPRTVRRMVARGQLTGWRVTPRMLRIDLNELEATLRPIPTGGGVGV